MKKKVLAALLCVAMTAGMLVGCGAAGSETSAPSDGGAAQAEAPAGPGSAGTNVMEVEGDDITDIEVWTFIELHQQFYTDMAEKWNEEHPDKKVRLTLSNLAYDDMHNKLSLALESGEGAPDVVDIELGKFPSFTNGEIGLRDLTDVLAPYMDKIVKSRLEIYGKNGKYYGLPTHVGATVAFYNTDGFDEAGIKVEDIKTWDDFKEAGVKYHDATGKYFACVETTAQWMINLMLRQMDGDYLDANGNIDLTNDKMVEVLEYIKGMQDTGAFATVPGGQPDNEEAYPSYNSGDYAVQIMPFWQTSRFINYMTDLKGKVTIAPVPVWHEGDAVKSIGGGGTGTAIVATSDVADLAAEVFAYIKLSDEANREVWNVLGFDPVNTEVWTDESLTKNPDNQFVQFFANPPFDPLLEIQDGIMALDSLTDAKFPSINNEFCTVLLNNIYENGMDVREALEQSQATLKNEFGE